ncbi:MAG: hypothetical protein AAFR17_04215 [Pseudomonadota bacterium]
MPAPAELSERAGLPSDAPCLDGHFPGNPIVPGAMLLAEAQGWLSGQGLRLESIRRMKFLRPLPPETAFTIAMVGQGAQARLTWSAGAEILAEAQVTLAPQDD